MSVPPRLVDATIAPDGQRNETVTAPGHRVVSSATASLVTQMLEGVVRQGTGACAAVTGFDVAGKTGTSRKPIAGGYSSSQHMASFVGYAPAEAPRIAAIVVLDSPDDVYGGRASAPVFSEIMQAALRSERVVPPPPSTNPPQWQVAQQSAASQRTSCQVPHGPALYNHLAAQQAAAAAAAKAAQDAAAQAAKDRARRGAKPKSHTAGTAGANGTATPPRSGTNTSTPPAGGRISPPTSGGATTGTGTVAPTTTAPNG